MTFVLGLVAEPVPIKSINQPTGDRLAEVKGRQIIDKYNCAGCHLIRPGVFDFRLTKEGRDLLDQDFDGSKKTLQEIHRFPKNYNWSGKNPESPDWLTAQAMYNFKFFLDENTDKPVANQFFKLVHALPIPA